MRRAGIKRGNILEENVLQCGYTDADVVDVELLLLGLELFEELAEFRSLLGRQNETYLRGQILVDLGLRNYALDEVYGPIVRLQVVAHRRHVRQLVGLLEFRQDQIVARAVLGLEIERRTTTS